LQEKKDPKKKMHEPLMNAENPIHVTTPPSLKQNDNQGANTLGEKDAEGNWEKDFAERYDFCIVLPAKDGEPTDRGRGYIKTLRKLGLELFIFKNLREQTEVFILLRASLEKLRAFADRINMPMLLDSQEIQSALAAGDAEKGIAPIVINDIPDVTSYKPYQYIYGKYSRLAPERLYWRDSLDTPFRELIRLKLCALILETRPDGGKSENLKIARYLRNGWMLGCFPLHDRAKTELLEYKMSFYPMQTVPLDDLKEYFGEKIGLYFGFVEHYTTWLIAPAVIGVPFQIAVFATGDYSAPFLPFFSVFIALWAVFMLEFWKRKEKTLAMKWGTLDFESNETDRPDFRGEIIKSFIDGSEIRYFPSKRRNFLLVQSFAGIVSLIMLVVGIVVSIYLMQYQLSKDVNDSDAQTVASVANAVQIQIVNYIYSMVAYALSDRENHR
jgi:hypothetical protein